MRRTTIKLLAAGCLLLSSTIVFGRAGGGNNYASRQSSEASASTSGGGFGGSSIIFWGVIGFIAFRCYKSESFRKKLFSSVSVGKDGLKFNVGALVVNEAQKVVAHKTGKDVSSLVMDTFRLKNDFIAGQLTAIDSSFDEAAFIARSKAAFEKVQSAWSEGALKEIRPFVTDGVFEKFSVQLEELKKQGLTNKLSNLKVMSTALTHLEFEGQYAYLTVEVRAIANDETRDHDQNLIKCEDAAFSEFWTFLRKKTAITQTGKAGLLESACPCCGAPLAVNQNAKCESCGSLVRGGDYDWVLSEITQDGEALSNRGFNFAQSSLAKRDVNACSQLIEDSASVMFSRLARAKNEANPAFIKKCASNKFYNTVSADKTPASYKETAIGSVEVTGTADDKERGLDLCFVDVVWSSVDFGKSAATKKHSSLVLARKSSAASANTAGFGVTHCHGCGAPEDGSANNGCPYCGYVFNDGSKEWVMIDFVPSKSSLNPSLYLNEKADDLGAVY